MLLKKTQTNKQIKREKKQKRKRVNTSFVPFSAVENLQMIIKHNFITDIFKQYPFECMGVTRFLSVVSNTGNGVFIYMLGKIQSFNLSK